MRADIIPGGVFPDFALPDHTGTIRSLGDVQGDDPLILTLARGHYCPKEHQQHLELAAFQSKIAVAYTQIATISTDDHHTSQEFRASVGAPARTARPPSTPTIRCHCGGSSTSCRTRSTMCWSPRALRSTDRCQMDREEAREAISGHMVLALDVARHVAGRVRPGGTLLLMSGTGGRRIAPGIGITSTVTAAMPAFAATLALELAPVRVNVIAPGFVDTPLSALLLGDDLDARREQLRATLPIHRVVGADDVAALAIHLMTNTALTGATYDVDGGQQFVP